MNGPSGGGGPGMPGFGSFGTGFGMGMPPMMMGNSAAPDGAMAQEYMKLQNDFFKWQDQLMANQHVLHSRVAPLATNPPTLQGPGVSGRFSIFTHFYLLIFVGKLLMKLIYSQ